MADTSVAKDPNALWGTILAEMALGRIRLHPGAGEPHYLHGLRRLLLQMRRVLGEDQFKVLLEHQRDSVHALFALLFDRVTGVEHEKTLERLRNLSTVQRVMVERIADTMTGRGGVERDNRRWADELWEARSYVEAMTTTSVSGVTPEEFRAGMDPVLHQFVDVLLARQNTLLS